MIELFEIHTMSMSLKIYDEENRAESDKQVVIVNVAILLHPIAVGNLHYFSEAILLS